MSSVVSVVSGARVGGMGASLILNLLPIPVLDGGHVLFMAIESVRRKPVPAVIRGYAQMTGVVLLLTLMLAVTINDANTFFGLKQWLAKFF